MLSEILVSVAAEQQTNPLKAACGPPSVDNWSATAAARLGKPYTWRDLAAYGSRMVAHEVAS
jgi:hypothetical protein